MKLSKFLAIFTLCVCLSGVALRAQDAPAANGGASKEDVERFLAVMHANNGTAKILDAMRKQMKQVVLLEMQKTKPTASLDEQDAAVEKAMKPLDKIWNETVIHEMESDMVPVYQHHFTHDEIVQLTLFYSTPVGQKMLNEMPAVMSEFMQQETPRIQKIMEDAVEEAKAAALAEQEKADREKADENK